MLTDDQIKDLQEKARRDDACTIFLPSDIRVILSDLEKARQALTDILHPLAYLERKAKAEGANLNSQAPAIANNIGTLQGIARDALR